MGYIIIDDCNVTTTKKLNNDSINDNYWFIDGKYIHPKEQHIELTDEFYKSLIKLSELECTGHIIVRLDFNSFGKYVLKNKKITVHFGKIIYSEIYQLELNDNNKIEMKYNDRN